MVAEYSVTILQRRYVHGSGTDQPILWYEGIAVSAATRRYLMADERGSITSVSDNAGAILAINRYDEYGIPASTNLGRFGYTGQTWLPEIGMWHYRARIYAPTLGRFLQTDPIGYGDGMNLYAYVGGDPVNFVDPLGLWGMGDDTIPVPDVLCNYSNDPKCDDIVVVARCGRSTVDIGGVCFDRNSLAGFLSPFVLCPLCLMPDTADVPDRFGVNTGPTLVVSFGAGGTGILRGSGGSVNAERGYSIPINSLRSGNLQGMQSFDAVSLTVLTGAGNYVAGGLQGSIGSGNGPVASGFNPSIVAAGGIATPRGGLEGAISVNDGLAQITRSLRAGFGGFAAGGARQNLVRASTQRRCGR